VHARRVKVSPRGGYDRRLRQILHPRMARTIRETPDLAELAAITKYYVGALWIAPVIDTDDIFLWIEIIRRLVARIYETANCGYQKDKMLSRKETQEYYHAGLRLWSRKAY
jgi:hypothetical protein